MTLKRLGLFLILAFWAFLAAAYGYYQYVLEKPLPLGSSQIIEIKKGDSLLAVLNTLKAKDILDNRSTLVARLYARQHKLASLIKVGEFRLNEGITIPSLFSIVTSNRRVQHSLTIVEGSTFSQARDLLKKQALLTQTTAKLSHEELLAALLNRAQFSVILGVVGENKTALNHHEGLLYPDTYFFHKGDTDLSILKRAHDRLLRVLKEEWAKRQKNLPLKNAYEALILASIVEKETGHPEERDQIAGVFTRRLEKKMRLQTDPTVIYGMGDRYDGNIRRKDLKEYTPYNTYRINGLPPTPIALVGREAIHAALNPAKGESLYFVAKGDGSHYFSKTITEHNRAVRKYQLKRRSDYRSTHQSAN